MGIQEAVDGEAYTGGERLISRSSCLVKTKLFSYSLLSCRNAMPMLGYLGEQVNLSIHNTIFENETTHVHQKCKTVLHPNQFLRRDIRGTAFPLHTSTSSSSYSPLRYHS